MRELLTRLAVLLYGVLGVTACVRAQAVGEETVVEFVAPWPPWVTIVLMALAGCLVYGLYYREQTEFRSWVKFALATLRMLLICLVIWMMYGYTLRPFRTDLPDMLVVLDTSESMSTVDAQTGSTAASQPLAATLQEVGFDEASRLNQAKTVLLRDDAKLLKFISKNYQPRLITLDDSNSTSTDSAELAESIRSLEANAPQSSLGLTLRRTMQRQRGRPVAAVIYLTDGVTTDGPPLSEVALEARQRKVPLHIVGLGSEQPVRDLRLSDLLVDDVVFVGDLVNFDFTLAGDGFPDEEIEISVRRADGQGETVTEIARLTSPSDSRPVRLTFEAIEEGNHQFIVEVASRDGEVTTDNNRLTATVDVRDEVTRVLLVQAYPSFEYHYLNTLLSRAASSSDEKNIQLSVLLQEADPEFSATDVSAIRSFPSRDQLFEYDVCIFGDVNPSLLGSEALADLRDFVRERGRGFIGIAGPRYFPAQYTDSPIAEILPFSVQDTLAPPQDLPIDTGFRLAVTPLGYRMPAMQMAANQLASERIWSELPELYWLLEVDELKPGVRVLAEHPDRNGSSGQPLPVTTLSYVGAGKVLFQNTDDSWRWRIGRGDEFFGRYWQQSIRYLSRYKLGEGRDIELSTDRESYRRGEVVRLRARFFDERRSPDANDGVVVMVEQENRGPRRIRLQRESADRGGLLGRRNGTLGRTPPGVDVRTLVLRDAAIRGVRSYRSGFRNDSPRD